MSAPEGGDNSDIVPDSLATSLSDLIAKIRRSGASSELQVAISNAALLLECHVRPVDMSPDDFYERMIPSELLKRPLRDSEQLALIDAMKETFLANAPGSGRGSLLWAIGKGAPWMVYRALSEILAEATLTSEERWQLMDALGRSIPLSLEETDDLDWIVLRRLAVEIESNDIREPLRALLSEPAEIGGEYDITAEGRLILKGIELLVTSYEPGDGSPQGS